MRRRTLLSKEDAVEINDEDAISSEKASMAVCRLQINQMSRRLMDQSQQLLFEQVATL
jgi:hypothetical protein